MSTLKAGTNSGTTGIRKECLLNPDPGFLTFLPFLFSHPVYSFSVYPSKSLTPELDEYSIFILFFNSTWDIIGASLVAQMVKNLPAVQETWVRFLGWEDPLHKEMATHSSILTWRIPSSEEPGRLQSMGSKRIFSSTTV